MKDTKHDFIVDSTHGELVPAHPETEVTALQEEYTPPEEEYAPPADEEAPDNEIFISSSMEYFEEAGDFSPKEEKMNAVDKANKVTKMAAFLVSAAVIFGVGTNVLFPMEDTFSFLLSGSSASSATTGTFPVSQVLNEFQAIENELNAGNIVAAARILNNTVETFQSAFLDLPDGTNDGYYFHDEFTSWQNHYSLSNGFFVNFYHAGAYLVQKPSQNKDGKKLVIEVRVQEEYSSDNEISVSIYYGKEAGTDSSTGNMTYTDTICIDSFMNSFTAQYGSVNGNQEWDGFLYQINTNVSKLSFSTMEISDIYSELDTGNYIYYPIGEDGTISVANIKVKDLSAYDPLDAEFQTVKAEAKSEGYLVLLIKHPAYQDQLAYMFLSPKLDQDISISVSDVESGIPENVNRINLGSEFPNQ